MKNKGYERKRITVPNRYFRTKTANRSRVLDGVDGRSLVARRYREISAAIEIDMGGDLTEAQLQLVRSAAGLAILRENLDTKIVNGEPIRIEEYCTISNSLRRILKTCGLTRVARHITPAAMSRIIDMVRDPKPTGALS